MSGATVGTDQPVDQAEAEGTQQLHTEQPPTDSPQPFPQHPPYVSTNKAHPHAVRQGQSEPHSLPSAINPAACPQTASGNEDDHHQHPPAPTQHQARVIKPEPNPDVLPSPSSAPSPNLASPHSQAGPSAGPTPEDVSPFYSESLHRMSTSPSPSQLVLSAVRGSTVRAKPSGATQTPGSGNEGEGQGPSLASPPTASPPLISPTATHAPHQPLSSVTRIQSAFAGASAADLQPGPAMHTSPQSPPTGPQGTAQAGTSRGGTCRDGVAVVCNGLRGMFHTRTKLITCQCSKCSLSNPAVPDMSPTEFERHAGMAASKKWKYSIKVGADNLNMTLGTWLERQGLIKKKLIKRQPVKPSAVPAATSPASFQQLMAAQAQLMSAGHVRLEGLTPAALSVLASRQVSVGASEGKLQQVAGPMEGVRMEPLLGANEGLYARPPHGLENDGRSPGSQEQMAKRGQQTSPTGPVTPGATVISAFPQSLSTMMQHTLPLPPTSGPSPTAPQAPSLYHPPTVLGPASHPLPPHLPPTSAVPAPLRTPTLQTVPLSSRAPPVGHSFPSSSYPPAATVSPFLSHPNPTAVLHGTTTPTLGLSSGPAERAKTPSMAQSPRMEGEWKPRGAFEGRTPQGQHPPDPTERSDSASDRPHWDSGMTHRRSGDSTADLELPQRAVQLMQPPMKRFRDHEKRSSGSSREQLTSNLMEPEAAPLPQIVSWLMTNGGEKLRLTVSFNGILFSGAVRNAGRMVQTLEPTEQDALVDDPYRSAGLIKRPRITPPSTPVEPSPVSSHRTSLPVHPGPDALAGQCELCHMPAGEELVVGSPGAAGPQGGAPRLQGGGLGPLISINVGPGTVARVHRLCMLWCPEVKVNEWTGDLDGVLEGFTRAVSTRCSSCYKLGAGLSCSHPGCDNCYHVNCARKSGCVMQVEPYLVHCPEHVGQHSEEEDAAAALMKLTGPSSTPPAPLTFTSRLDHTLPARTPPPIPGHTDPMDEGRLHKLTVHAPGELQSSQDPFPKPSHAERAQHDGAGPMKDGSHGDRIQSGGRMPFPVGLRFPTQTMPSLWQRAASGFPAALQQPWPASNKATFAAPPGLTVSGTPGVVAGQSLVAERGIAGKSTRREVVPGRRGMQGDEAYRGGREDAEAHGGRVDNPGMHHRNVAHERPESKGSRLEATSSDSDEEEDDDEEEQSTSEEERMKAQEQIAKLEARPMPTLKVSPGVSTGVMNPGPSHLQGMQKGAVSVPAGSDADPMDVDKAPCHPGHTLKIARRASQVSRQDAQARDQEMEAKEGRVRAASPSSEKMMGDDIDVSEAFEGKGRTAVSVPALADYPPNMLLTQLHLMQAHLAAQHAQRASSSLGEHQGREAQPMSQSGSPREQTSFPVTSLAALSPSLTSRALQLMPFVTLPQVLLSSSSEAPFGLGRANSPEHENSLNSQGSPTQRMMGGMFTGPADVGQGEDKSFMSPGFGGTTGHVGRPGRCAVCIVQRKGKCGTPSAPKRCLRRVVYGPVLRSGATGIQSAQMSQQHGGPVNESGEQVEGTHREADEEYL